MTSWENDLEKLRSTPPKMGEFEALLIESRLKNLANASKGIGHEHAHEVFLDICKQAVAALELHEGKLAQSPSAPALLNYLMHGMRSYIQSMGPTASTSEESGKKSLKKITQPNNSTTSRRDALAKAWMLTGAKLSGLEEQERIEICCAFSKSLEEQTDSNSISPNKRQVSIANQAAYQAHWKTKWIKDDQKSKDRMKTITRVLKEEGYA